MGIKSLDELRAIRERSSHSVQLRQGEEYRGKYTAVLVGMGTCGIAAGARETLAALVQELAEQGAVHARVTPVGCAGHCRLEPLVLVNIPGKAPCAYGNITKEKVADIVRRHIVGGEPVRELVVDVPLP